jgi:hypothetical protein
VAGGTHGVVLDLKAGASAPPLFGLRHFPVELAGLRGVFMARLRRGNFFVYTSGRFFLPPEPSRSAKWASACPLLLKTFALAAPNSAGASDPLVCPSLFRALPTVRYPCAVDSAVVGEGPPPQPCRMAHARPSAFCGHTPPHPPTFLRICAWFQVEKWGLPESTHKARAQFFWGIADAWGWGDRSPHRGWSWWSIRGRRSPSGPCIKGR